MKKLAVFFIILISLVVIAGCNNSKKTVTKFSSDEASDTSETTSDDGTKTIVTKVDEKGKTDPAAIEIPVTDDAKSTVKSTPAEDVKFAVTTPDTDTIQSNKGYHLIQGTTPADTDKIFVNDVALSKFKSGATQWNYIAAASLGTLKKGDNIYTIKAVDKDGNTLGAQDITITYKGIENGVLAPTGNDGITVSLALALFISFIAFYARPLFIKIRN
jgi:hypothetical protein